jgi:uncharacterized protein
MKLHLAVAGARNQFTGYGAGYVAVNQQRYEHAIVVTPDALHENWNVRGVESLDADAVQFLLTLKPEILLLGTGATQRFPSPAALREFAQAQIGVETMDTAAACRTFNILMAEGRNVVAAIMV